MNKLFEKLTAAQFKMVNILIPVISDIYICFYLYIKFIDHEFFKKSMSVAIELVKSTNPTLMSDSIPSEFIDELWIKYTTTFFTLIAFYIIIHSLIFFFSYLGKKYCLNYINFYSKSASFLMIIFSIFSKFSLFNLGFIFIGILHIFNFSGMKYFKIQEE